MGCQMFGALLPLDCVRAHGAQALARGETSGAAE